MNTHRAFWFVIASLALAASSLVFAADANGDRATQLLARDGTVRIAAAGPYVEIGTYRIQVVVKLGQPSAKLPDGTWLYQDRQIEGSTARGALVMRFTNGRVSSLSFVTPTVATAMLNQPRPSDHVYAASGH
jgi:hypothetical protein